MTQEVKGLIVVLVAPLIIGVQRNWDRLGALQSAQAEDREKKVACEWLASELTKDGVAGKKQSSALTHVLTTRCYGMKFKE